jgi:hypothetical protein
MSKSPISRRETHGIEIDQVVEIHNLE